MTNIKYAIGEFALGLFQRKPLEATKGRPILRFMDGERTVFLNIRNPVYNFVDMNMMRFSLGGGGIIKGATTLDTCEKPKPEFNMGTTL